VISILADLEHVLKYDKVAIIDHGKVAEFGDPKLLIRDKKSRLYERLQQTDTIRFRNIMKTVSRFSIDLKPYNDSKGSFRLTTVEKPLHPPLTFNTVEKVDEQSESAEYSSSLSQEEESPTMRRV